MTSEVGVGSTFSFNVILQKVTDSPTYGEKIHINELASKCYSPLIVTDEKKFHNLAWRSLLLSLSIPSAKIVGYKESMQYLNELEKSKVSPCKLHSVIIIDMDLRVIEEFGTQPVSSEKVLENLRSKFPDLVSLPTLCVCDLRCGKSNKIRSLPLTIREQVNFLCADENLAPQEDVACTLIEVSHETKNNSHSSIFSPFKNSNLISVLHKLTKESSKAQKRNVDSLRAASTSENVPACNKQTQTLSVETAVSIERPRYVRQRNKSFSSQISTESQQADSLSNIRSLLVDDNPINFKVMTRMLTRMGMKPQVAQNGREACDIVALARDAGEPIDLIFMDIWMPEMNGLQAATKIRTDLAYTTINPYIIAMTACVMPGDREKCIDAGMNGYVSKPVRKEELDSALHTYTQAVAMSDILLDDKNSVEAKLNQYSDDDSLDDEYSYRTSLYPPGDICTPPEELNFHLPAITVSCDD